MTSLFDYTVTPSETLRLTSHTQMRSLPDIHQSTVPWIPVQSISTAIQIKRIKHTYKSKISTGFIRHEVYLEIFLSP